MCARPGRVGEPVQAQQPVLERRGERRVGEHAGVLEVVHVEEQQRPPGAAAATIAPASARTTISGSRVGTPSSRSTSATAAVAAGDGGRHLDAAQRHGGADVAQLARRAEQERGQAVGDLDGAVGQRRGRRRVGAA